MDIVLTTIILLAIVASLYACHRLALSLEQRGLIHYWHTKPSGGSAYNPLQEIIQPQIRHVVQVEEQRSDADFEGSPPDPGDIGQFSRDGRLPPDS